MEESTQIDIKEKRQQLAALWNDLFEVCKAIVDSVKAGQTTLRGSMLRELNMFLRESSSILNNLELIQKQEEVDQMYSATESDTDCPLQNTDPDAPNYMPFLDHLGPVEEVLKVG